MNRVIESIERRQLRADIPPFKAGDSVRVHFQVIEGQRRRTQVFEGTVIKRQGAGLHETFTVRKQSFGVGVERSFPLHSPKIERIDVVAIGDVSRAKLYYLRQKVGKRARVRTKTGAVLPRVGAAATPPPDAPAPDAPAPEVSGDGASDVSGDGASEASEDGAGDELAAAHASADSAAGEPSASGGDAAPETERE